MIFHAIGAWILAAWLLESGRIPIEFGALMRNELDLASSSEGVSMGDR
jgi:hypothetical protein